MHIKAYFLEEIEIRAPIKLLVYTNERLDSTLTTTHLLANEQREGERVSSSQLLLSQPKSLQLMIIRKRSRT